MLNCVSLKGVVPTRNRYSGI